MEHTYWEASTGTHSRHSMVSGRMRLHYGTGVIRRSCTNDSPVVLLHCCSMSISVAQRRRGRMRAKLRFASGEGLAPYLAFVRRELRHVQSALNVASAAASIGGARSTCNCIVVI